MDTSPYRTLHWIVEHGDTGVVFVIISILLLGTSAIVLTQSYLMTPLLIFGTALLYIVARSYVELVRVIVDMLLPK